MDAPPGAKTIEGLNPLLYREAPSMGYNNIIVAVQHPSVKCNKSERLRLRLDSPLEFSNDQIQPVLQLLNAVGAQRSGPLEHGLSLQQR